MSGLLSGFEMNNNANPQFLFGIHITTARQLVSILNELGLPAELPSSQHTQARVPVCNLLARLQEIVPGTPCVTPFDADPLL